MSEQEIKDEVFEHLLNALVLLDMVQATDRAKMELFLAAMEDHESYKSIKGENK